MKRGEFMRKQYDDNANTFFNKSLDSLSHFGVAGMKWGVRNEDTLRKYGLRKYGSKSTEKLANKRSRLEKRIRKIDSHIEKNSSKIAKMESKNIDLKWNQARANVATLNRKQRKAQRKNDRIEDGKFTISVRDQVKKSEIQKSRS